MRLLSFLSLLLLSLLLNACGGGGGETPPANSPVAMQTQGLQWVDVQDGQGNTLMQHRYAAGASADEDVVTTTQDAGRDGRWGTADDWRTAVMRCRYQAGNASSPIGFGIDGFFTVSPAGCTWRRPLSGNIQVEISGAPLSEAVLAHLRPATATANDLEQIAGAGWQPYLDSGDLIALLDDVNGAPVEAAFRLTANATGVTLCREDCTATGSVSSTPVKCGVLCDIVITAPVSDGLSIGLGPNDCGAASVNLYDGVRAHVLGGGRLDRVVYSHALNRPFCQVAGYDQYLYDSGGRFLGTQSYDGSGSDGIWLTADDVVSARVSVESLSDGRLQIVYTGAGPDLAWNTADDDIGQTSRLQLSATGRLLKATQCTGSGEDELWQTADDVCQVLVFHYADEH